MNELTEAFRRVLSVANRYLKELDERGHAMRLNNKIYSFKELTEDFKILSEKIGISINLNDEGERTREMLKRYFNTEKEEKK